jgi:DNA-binding MarR family transcriptional regulator
MNITNNDKRVLTAIDALLAEETAPITYNLIHKRSLVSMRTICRSIDRLSRAGYLDTERDPGLPYTYKILKRPDQNNGG